jgi:hypothetical protein
MLALEIARIYEVNLGKRQNKLYLSCGKNKLNGLVHIYEFTIGRMKKINKKEVSVLKK